MDLKMGYRNTSTLFKLSYLLKVILMFSLCRIHDYTRYKVCRNLSDLFYWPEGLCIDMLVVFSTFIMGALIIRDYMIYMEKCKIKAEL